jgi:hypothetical protein
MHSMRYVACGLIVLLCLAGCGRRGEMAEINGAVTYGGQPLRKGLVKFFPVDGKGRTAAGVVVDGRYSACIGLGQKNVQIEGFKVAGRGRAQPENPNSPMVDIEEQILPDRYNAKTELTCEITSGNVTYDFRLEK